MDIFRRIFFVVVLSGAMAGLVNAAIQQWRVVPLILEAELYEVAPHSHESVAEAQTPHSHVTSETNAEPVLDGEPWAPKDGLERTAYTILATFLMGLGFAFLMAAMSIFSKIEVTSSNGLLWGLAGFLTFSLMPAIGLAPELPGMVAAELGARQIWWWFAVGATTLGILSVAKFPNWAGITVGLVLVSLPHLLGAPVPPQQISDVPAHLATSFAANALFASLAFWLTLGALFGFFNHRTKKEM